MKYNIFLLIITLIVNANFYVHSEVDTRDKVHRHKKHDKSTEKRKLKTHLSKNRISEHAFVFVVCSYNNAPWIEKCLASILGQKYTRFRVICIDDASTDNTLEIIENYVRKNNFQNKVTIVKNSERRRKLYNIYNAFHSCQDSELIVQVDGDDHLANADVLSHLNRIFIMKKIWFSYGQYKDSSGRKSLCSKIPKDVQKNGLYRKHPWVTTHLKVFAAWLAKMIKLESLLTRKVPQWEGRYYPAANDWATIYPILEMSREKIHFNSKVIYVYNRNNPTSSFSSAALLQQSCGKDVKSLPVYARIDAPILNRLECYRNAQADCLIVCHSVPALEGFLRSLTNFVQNVDTVIIVYQAEKDDLEVIQRLKKQFKNIFFYNAFELLDSGKLSQILQSTKNNHILCMNDDFSFNVSINCRNWILELERTFAYGCYGLLGCRDFEKYNIPFQHVNNTLYAWKFLCDANNNIKPNNFNMSLYRKKDILQFLQNNSFMTLNDFMHGWSSIAVDTNKVGLFFDAKA